MNRGAVKEIVSSKVVNISNPAQGAVHDGTETWEDVAR